MPFKDPEKARANARKRSTEWRERHPDRARASRRKHYEKHRDQQCARAREWYYANKERALVRLRTYHMRVRYGLTVEQVAALGNACAICGSTSDSRAKKDGKPFRLAVDHDHGTKKIRGLLCGNCNCGIGYFKHDEGLMQKAIDYLRRTA